jgi:hypothetical protein
MGMILVRYWNPQNQPILDSIMKAWVDAIQQIDFETQVMYLDNNINYATGSDLDTKWGDIYELPRLASESDASYVKRIKAYVTMQTGSGTLSTLQTVIDTTIGVYGQSLVITRLPGHIDIKFGVGSAADAARRAAKNNISLLNYVMPQAVAAGVGYTVYLDYIDYFFITRLLGSMKFSYIANLLSQIRNIDYTYSMHFMQATQLIDTITMDVSTQRGKSRSILAFTNLTAEFDNVCRMISRFKIALPASYFINPIIKMINIKFLYILDLLARKTIISNFVCNATTVKARNVEMYMSVRLI